MKNLLHICKALFLGLLLVSCGRADRMRTLLEQAEWMNQHDSLFTSDSIGRTLVSYYDHWWHPADLRLRAYYMLGCAYRDMGEAPAAIHYYTIATEKADTAHADSATYATLFRVYGQMAMIYEQQNMPEGELTALSDFCRYAQLARDTLSYIVGMERKIMPYYELDDTLHVLEQTEIVRRLYKKQGYDDMAASVYPTAILISIKNGNYRRAHVYMDIFEKKSGLFDKEGNIESGREQYYYSKGLYQMGIGHVDSAEYYFRRLMCHGFLIDAYDGLISVYKARGVSDSVAHFASLYTEELGRWRGSRQAETLIQSSSMYRYERNRNTAIINHQRAITFKLISIFIATSAVLILSFIYRYFRLRNAKQERRLQKLREEFMNALAERGRLVEECEILQRTIAQNRISDEAQAMIKKKQERIEKLEQTLVECKSSIYMLDYAKREKLLKESEIVKYFSSKKIPTLHWKSPSPEQWREISNVYRQYMPLASAYMDRVELSRQEYYTCILTHLGFASGEIAILLETKSSRISNAKHSAGEKLFGKNTAVKLRKRIIDIECETDVK